jgi:hypothetical protein
LDCTTTDLRWDHDEQADGAFDGGMVVAGGGVENAGEFARRLFDRCRGDFHLRGAATIPEASYDKHMFVERRDGALWMLVRTKSGLGESFSTDRGATWSPGQRSAVAGDDRLLNHPFLKMYPGWVVQHYQPGGSFINAFDCFGAARLPALGRPPVADVAPPLWTQCDRARRVNWRSSSNEDATGVWIRGGHKDDQHDHAGRGHLNFIYRGNPILIEAGTPYYHNAKLATHYASAAATVNMTDAHPDELQRGVRWVTWDAGGVRVVDAVTPTTPEGVQFRWHLGTGKQPQITGEEKAFTVVWPDAEMTLTADAELEITCKPMPDHTLEFRKNQIPDVDHLHTCLVVRTTHPVAQARLTTVTKEKPE